MFAVIFEVRPIAAQWDKYMRQAGLLRPELERIDGFVENIRYRSLGRPGWLLSFSTWRDEAALIRWRTHALHHRAQETARREIFDDYHLRVGEIFADSDPAAICATRENATEAGEGRVVSVIEAPSGSTVANGFTPVEEDRFEAILTPGAGVRLITSRDLASLPPMDAPPGMRRRDVGIIRDYGMFDRREAPQVFPEVVRR